MYEFQTAFGQRDLDAILDDVRYDMPQEAGPTYVAEYVIRRIREAMEATGTVFYQP